MSRWICESKNICKPHSSIYLDFAQSPAVVFVPPELYRELCKQIFLNRCDMPDHAKALRKILCLLGRKIYGVAPSWLHTVHSCKTGVPYCTSRTETSFTGDSLVCGSDHFIYPLDILLQRNTNQLEETVSIFTLNWGPKQPCGWPKPRFSKPPKRCVHPGERAYHTALLLSHY